MIYLYRDMDHIPDEIIRETYALMPLERRLKASRYMHKRDKYLCVLAYWLLMFGLRKEYGITDAPVFLYGDNGKPFLSGYDIHFNLSHCAAGVVCAISDGEAGVDIQEITAYDEAVARLVCTESELAMLAASSSPERIFCELWTIKESFIKLSGKGLAQPLNELDAYEAFQNADIKKTTIWKDGFHICGLGEDMIHMVDLRR